MRSLFCVPLLLVIEFSFCQTFKGKAPEFSNQTIAVFEHEDFFSATRIEKLNQPVEADGSFIFRYAVAQPKYVEILLGGIYSGVYVRPNFEYEFVFDKHGKISNIISEDSTNALIRDFDARDEALFQYQKKKSYATKEMEFVRQEKNKLNDLPPFARDIIKYRLSGREVKAYVHANDTVALNAYEQGMFLNASINAMIPDYFSALRRFYYERAKTLGVRRTKFNQQYPFLSMTNEAKVVINDSIRELAYLTIVSIAYNRPDWSPPKDELNRLVDSIHAVTKNKKVIQVATQLKRKNNTLLPGTRISDFSFEDYVGVTHSLASYAGKYVLIDFWFVGCSGCVQNFPNLKRLKEQSGDRLEILSLTPYDSSERIAMFLKKRPQFDWVFAPIERHGTLLEYFSVSGYPTYFLIDPDGKLIQQINFSEREHTFDTILSYIQKN